MWHLTNIPKIAHFYWGGQRLSYLRFLTIKSFRALNPDWQIKMHTPTHLSASKPAFVKKDYVALDGTDYFNCVREFGVEIIAHDFEDSIGNEAWEVHKSDFLRWQLLGTEGGLWSDFDIIYQNPLDNLLENNTENHELTTILCPYQLQKIKFAHSIGFLLSSKSNKFFQYICQQAKEKYNPLRFQSIGNELMRDYRSVEDLKSSFPSETFAFAHEKCVYSIVYTHANDFFKPLDDFVNQLLTSPSVLGFHWYGGHDLSKTYDEGFGPESTDANLINTVAKKIEEATHLMQSPMCNSLLAQSISTSTKLSHG